MCIRDRSYIDNTTGYIPDNYRKLYTMMKEIGEYDNGDIVNKICREQVSEVYVAHKFKDEAKEKPNYIAFVIDKEANEKVAFTSVNNVERLKKIARKYVHGFSFGYKFNHKKSKHKPEHSEIYIDVICTKPGIGSNLLTNIIEHSKDIGIDVVKLSSVGTASLHTYAGPCRD